MKKNWWHEAVVYQIYPRSFKDSGADGIGDLTGIIEKLDYLAGLGINTIWLCPIFTSPMVDNGYDISDYRDINPEFGTLADLERLIAEADTRGIKILLDLVLNHTSDQHPWFQAALHDPQNPCRDFYIFRRGKDGGPPNNWRSYFGGSAWEQVGDGEYYLHLFTKEQPDLNWENPRMRHELYDMIHFWMNKGVTGFRIDAICNIKKEQSFASLPPDESDGLANPVSSCVIMPGIEKFLGEMRDEVFKPRNAFTVAEAAGVTPEKLAAFIGPNGFFSTIFDFSYTDIDIIKGGGIWYKRRDFTVKELRGAIFKNQQETSEVGFAAPYLENHDQNRSTNKYLAADERTFEGKTMLAILYFFLQGIPFVYQGQELGVENYPWHSLDEFNDVATFDQYERAIRAGYSKEKALEIVAHRSRDNSRIPMMWSAEAKNAGFSAAAPWLPIHPDYAVICVDVQEKDPASVLSFYKKMITLRKAHSTLFFAGTITPRFLESEDIVSYERKGENELALIICNFSAKTNTVTVRNGIIWLGNIREAETYVCGQCTLAPFEALVIGCNT
ncbi:MAG: alpha-glucosidase [Treponema sp.]|jgi:glycosidase|nr:alpha-glucosidase [Treponema sp.]